MWFSSVRPVMGATMCQDKGDWFTGYWCVTPVMGGTMCQDKGDWFTGYWCVTPVMGGTMCQDRKVTGLLAIGVLRL